MTTTPSIDASRPIVGEMREGIPVEKGVVITEDFLVKNEELFQRYNQYFMLYPDLFLDTIATKTCPIKFYYYQRILLRSMMRYRYFFGTFTRATSKSFLAIMSCYLACMFLPRSKRFVVSEFKKSSLAIVKSKLEEIWTYWPLLKAEVLTQHMSTDYIELIFKNGSVFQILTLGASSRGQRATGGVMEEAALIDGTALAEVIIPMMNIPRMTADGGQNPEEPHSQQIYITSAGSKTTFAYERLIELTTLAVLEPQDYFICGASYELPLKYGLFDKKTIQDQKLSNSFSSEGFARESMSIWTGGSSESWFNAKKLEKSRALLNCERKYNLTIDDINNKGWFYLMSIDVARYGENDTSIFIFKVKPRDNGWRKEAVFTENLTKMNLLSQAAHIKALVREYRPQEVVIDGNGVGAGLIDALVVPSFGPNGESYEPLYVINDPDNYPIPRGMEKSKNAVIFNIKANASMNSEIYSNLYVQINSGNLLLLANERIVKDKLMATKKGQRMNYLAREKFLLPYTMTSRLIDEMNNLKLKVSSTAGQIAVEQISRRINKDRVSALSYGLYRIKYYEDKEVRKKKTGITDASKLAFFSSSKKNSNKRRHW